MSWLSLVTSPHAGSAGSCPCASSSTLCTTPCRFGSCNRKRERPSDCGQDQDGPGHDCHLLVHLPCCVLVPHVGHQRCVCCGLHPVGLLRVRHHLQVRCWHCDLPDHMRQV